MLDSTVAIVMTLADKLRLIESPLMAVFTTANLKQETIGNLSDAGIHSLALFCHICSTADALRQFLATGANFDLSDFKGDFLEAAKVIGAWEDARLVRTTVAKRQADQRAEFATPQIPLEDYEEARAQFQEAEHEIEDGHAPSKAYLERKLNESASIFRAERLTTVTTAAQEDNNTTTMPTVDPRTGVFRISTKDFAVAYPRDSEELRVRLRTLCYCHCMMRQHSPNRAILRSVSVTLFDRYIDWLFGPRVWGQTIKDLHGKAISSPTIELVMSYDFAIRKEICKQMNRGVDFAAALKRRRTQNYAARSSSRRYR